MVCKITPIEYVTKSTNDLSSARYILFISCNGNEFSKTHPNTSGDMLWLHTQSIFPWSSTYAEYYSGILRVTYVWIIMPSSALNAWECGFCVDSAPAALLRGFPVRRLSIYLLNVILIYFFLYLFATLNTWQPNHVHTPSTVMRWQRGTRRNSETKLENICCYFCIKFPRIII